MSTSRKRVARIMSENGWRGVTRACAKRPSGEKRSTSKESAEDLVRRDFSAAGPNLAWFADITYVKTRQGWLYLAVVMDVWSRMVVGWSMGPKITAELADEALKMAIARRRATRGIQGVGYLLLFRCTPFSKIAAIACIEPMVEEIMGRFGNTVLAALLACSLVPASAGAAFADDATDAANGAEWAYELGTYVEHEAVAYVVDSGVRGVLVGRLAAG